MCRVPLHLCLKSSVCHLYCSNQPWSGLNTKDRPMEQPVAHVCENEPKKRFLCKLFFNPLIFPKIQIYKTLWQGLTGATTFLVRNERGYESLCCDGFVFGRYKGNLMRCANRRCKGKILVDDVDNINRWSHITQHSLLHTKESLERYLSWRSRAKYVKQRDSRYIPRKLRIRETKRLDSFVSHCAASRFVDRNTPKPQNPLTLQDIDLSDPSLKHLLDKSDNNNALIF